jgi:hypothetical protein
LSAIVGRLDEVARIGTRFARMERLYETPEAVFARRGTTRDAELARIFG